VDQVLERNLAAGGTATPARPRGVAPVRAHRYDRVSALVGWGAALALGALAWAGRATLTALADAGAVAWLAAVLAAVAALAGALVFRIWLSPRIGHELGRLADVAEAVAAGDVSASARVGEHDGQLGRLARGMHAMTGTLGALVHALDRSSGDTAALAAEITASTEHMAGAATTMADTATRLSERSRAMADAIRALAAEAERLTGLATAAATGARAGVERNTRLRALAGDNRARLDGATARLHQLADDVQASATAVDALAAASDDVATFVALVQKIARQSKLLALNAAMEAARAGEQGEGFAVVADEVRRLAASTAEAAERTEQQIRDVLARVAASRAATARAQETVRSVLTATDDTRAAVDQIAGAVAESEAWTTTMAETAAATDALAREVTTRLGDLASGTEAFASAMHEVAASSEEQSASTQEIAGAASAMGAAAARMRETVTGLRR
jgi:methyl-accepting chemotaxis protein